MRKYALVVFDKLDNIYDRFDLDIITNPTDNGFKLSLSTISSDIEDIITKVVQTKNTIKFTVQQFIDPYIKANNLAAWIQKYSRPEYAMGLEYNDGKVVRYCEGKVTSLSKTELNEYKILAQNLEFTATTPYFIIMKNTINITNTSYGKSYSYTYPYNYGETTLTDNLIENPYILDIPLVVTIDGAIDSPTIELFDENGVSYNKVKFTGTSLLTGEQLVINSAQRKIFKVVNGKETDYAPEVDPQYDTFLRASSGTSRIYVNIYDSTDTFKISGGWRQYILW